MNDKKKPMNEDKAAQSEKRYREEAAGVEASGVSSKMTWTPEEIIHGTHVYKADSPEAKALIEASDKIKAEREAKENAAKDAHIAQMNADEAADNATKMARIKARAAGREE